MKISKLLLALSLLFAFSAAVQAAPTPAAASASSPSAEIQPADVFGVSVLSKADCGASAKVRQASGGGDPNVDCGPCSFDPCKGELVGWFCGFGPHGQVRMCQDWYGEVCAEGNGVHCRCTSRDIIDP